MVLRARKEFTTRIPGLHRRVLVEVPGPCESIGLRGVFHNCLGLAFSHPTCRFPWNFPPRAGVPEGLSGGLFGCIVAPSSKRAVSAYCEARLRRGVVRVSFM